jgi:hypothetical protein
MIKTLRYIVVTVLALQTSIGLCASTEEKLNACDSALYAKVREADLCNLGVQLRQNELERVTKENAELRGSQSAWYNNPFIFAAIGVIFGAYAGARATR